MEDTLIIRPLPGFGEARMVGETLAAKVALSIARFRQFEPMALSMHPDGYWLADSGGKDSCCILRLAQMAGVKFTAHHNLTGIDPPELVRFVRREHPETQIVRSPKTMWQLIVEKRMPPTHRMRYCCEHLKETGGTGRMVVLGIRWEESGQRKGRRMVESCRKNRADTKFLNPIIDWTADDVWEFIRQEKISYCSLYDEGWKRIGCIGCPCGRLPERLAALERYPRYAALYLRAFDRAVAAKLSVNARYEGSPARWSSGQAMMDWWLSLDEKSTDDDQPWLFGG